MEKFLGKLTRWMGANDTKLPTAQDDVQFAAAALMVHAMRVDDVEDPDEVKRVRDVLADRFDLDRDDLNTVIAKGTQADDEAVDLYRFTKILTANLDQTGRQDIVRMLWQVMFADGNIHEFESNLVWRVAELIGVSRADRIRLRQEVTANPKA